jgi:hypothetical protein
LLLLLSNCTDGILPLPAAHSRISAVSLLTHFTCQLQALPLFLDRLVDPFMAVLLSVSVVLIFGGCAQHGVGMIAASP